jgi:tetratricopeptide (TPR) repeat protein
MLDEQDQRIYRDVANRRKVLDEAEVSARRAVQLEPHTAAPYRVLGNILHVKRNFPGATEAYTNALRLQPTDPYSHYDFGVTLDGAHDHAAAVSQLVQAIRLNRNYAKAFAALSFALHNAGKQDLAIAALLETNRLAPTDENFSWLRKRVPATPDLVANINARAHAFEDDYAKFLLHELSP